MNTLLLEHLAAVSKIAAYRQAREHQEGVDASQGYLTTNAAGVLFEGPRTFVCHFKYETSSRLQGIAGFTVPMMALEIAPSTNLLRFYCGTTSATAPIVPGNNYQTVISYDGTTAVCYLNGSEAARFTVAGYAVTNVFRIGNPSYPPVGSVYSSSHFNYALSAVEVSALWNNGNPAGYKLPSNYKGYGDVYHSDFSEGADDWRVVLTDYVTMTVADGVITISKEDEKRNMNIARNHSPYASRVVNYFVRLEFAEPLPSEVGNIAARPFNSIVGVNLAISSDRLSASGTLISTIAKPNGGSMIIFQASGAVSISISSISFTPAVCIAEYLPQNLVVAGPGERTPVEITGNGSYTWTGVGDAIYSVKIGTSRSPVLGQWYLIKGAVSNYEAGTPYVSADTGYTEFALPRGNGEFQVFAQCRSTGPSSYFFTFRGGNKDTDRRLTVTIESIAPVNNIPSVWLDSAKQLPLNDEYLPPLLEPIVIGDATPIRITGDNSYTWIGSESPLNVWIQVAKSFAIGVTYKVNITVSNYEAGAPFVWLGSSVNVPAANGTYDILVPASVSQSYLPIYGGPSGSDRRLTLTVNKIEPVAERGYDLTANGTPEIIYK